MKWHCKKSTPCCTMDISKIIKESYTQTKISVLYIFIIHGILSFLIFYCCSITVVPIFSPFLSPALPTPIFHIQSSLLPLMSLSMGPLYMLLDLTLLLLSPVIPPLAPPLWSLSVCSLFVCLWFYFAHLFVLLIRFHLLVRSYSICVSLLG